MRKIIEAYTINEATKQDLVLMDVVEDSKAYIENKSVYTWISLSCSNDFCFGSDIVFWIDTNNINRKYLKAIKTSNKEAIMGIDLSFMSDNIDFRVEKLKNDFFNQIKRVGKGLITVEEAGMTELNQSLFDLDNTSIKNCADMGIDFFYSTETGKKVENDLACFGKNTMKFKISDSIKSKMKTDTVLPIIFFDFSVEWEKPGLFNFWEKAPKSFKAKKSKYGYLSACEGAIIPFNLVDIDFSGNLSGNIDSVKIQNSYKY